MVQKAKAIKNKAAEIGNKRVGIGHKRGGIGHKRGGIGHMRGGIRHKPTQLRKILENLVLERFAESQLELQSVLVGSLWFEI